MQKRVNIAKVAAEAGVGVGTVSRVLNDSPHVSDATRERVLGVMTRLHYHPSRLATGLSRGTTGAVAVLVTFLTRPSVVQRLAGVITVLDEAGYDTVVFNVETAEQRDRHVSALAREEHADGVIVMSLPLTEQHLRTLKAGGLPVVMLDAESPGPPRIVIDNEAGGRMATEYLLDLGHRRIAFVGDESYPDLAFTSTAHRLLGYRGALADAGIATDPHLIRLIPHGGFVLASSAMRSATELIETAEPPTAIFASSDTQAIGVVHAVEHRGLRVPDDISVIGFDDIDSAALVRLSTVRQPLHESGALAARRLCALLSGKRVGRRRTVLPLVLVRRSSTSPPRRRDGEGPRRHPAKGAADNGSSRSRPAIRARGPTGGSAPPARSIAWPEPA